MKEVTFGMTWTVYGRQTISLPDEVDENDLDAVRQYISSVWERVPVPDGNYIVGSDDLCSDDLEVHDASNPPALIIRSSYLIEYQINDCYDFLGWHRKDAFDMTEEELRNSEQELASEFEWIEDPFY